MFTAKFIKNIFLEAESIKAIGRSGNLIDGERAKDFEYVGRIQHEFLNGLNGLCSGGYKLREISDRANKCFGSKMCEAYTTELGIGYVCFV